MEKIMLDIAFLKVLRKINTRLNNTSVNWVITGSFGFALQGLPVEPNDIDIQTDKEGAYEIECHFSEFMTKRVTFSSTEKIRSHFGKLMIDGIKVEIMGGIQKRLENESWENPVDLDHHKRGVEVDGMKVPVLSLEYEYQAYMNLGRIETAEMLRDWLQGEHGFSNNTSPNSG
jgi:hypothetical protein